MTGGKKKRKRKNIGLAKFDKIDFFIKKSILYIEEAAY